MWYLIIAIVFSSVAIAELGDKSQIMTISLASKYEGRSVFLGIIAGLGVITIIGVTLGTIIFRFVPLFYVKLFAAATFILFGVYTFLSSQYFEEEKESRKEDEKIRRGKTVSSSFFLSFISELGDKTQFVVVAFAARYAAPFSVFLGAVLAFAAVTGLSVILGAKLGESIKSKKIDFITSAVFVILGITFLVEAVFLG
ncbi:MAG: TMEM165/GDT1 family protein [Candidatus Thermoplasmatota archaeon]